MKLLQDAPAKRAVKRLVTSENLVAFIEWALDRARQAIDAEKYAQVITLRDLDIHLVTANERYRGFSQDRLCQQKSTSAREAISVAVLSPDDSDILPPPCWHEPLYPSTLGNLLHGTPFHATYFHDEDLWQIYDHRERIGLQWMRSSNAYPAWESGAPLRVFLHWAYRFQGKRLVHAGTLGCNGVGILLAGKGGSGKSGTVVGGIVHGLESVGDDYVVVEPTVDGPVAYPLYRTLKQDAAGLKRLGLEATLAKGRQVNWQNKFEWCVEDIPERCMSDQLRIGALVTPRVTHESKSSITPLSRIQAMISLAPSSLFQLPGVRNSGVRFCANLVRSLPCHELRLGMDPREISQTLATFMERGFRCD